MLLCECVHLFISVTEPKDISTRLESVRASDLVQHAAQGEGTTQQCHTGPYLLRQGTVKSLPYQ